MRARRVHLALAGVGLVLGLVGLVGGDAAPARPLETGAIASEPAPAGQNPSDGAETR